MLVLTLTGAWAACLERSHLAVPGVLVATPGNPTLHLHCDDAPGSYDPATNVTVLFLHGFLGSGQDGSWVRRAAAFRRTGARYCSLDRPGYGFSEAYGGRQHFGQVAATTAAVLRAHGVRGKLVLLFHSLGCWHALAFAQHVREAGAAQGLGLAVESAVAVDAVVPRWEHWDKPTDPAKCSTSAPYSSVHPIWPLARTTRPSGLPRLLYAGNFGGYADVIDMYPEDLQGAVLAYSMRRKWFDAVIVEAEMWGINCGWARRAEGAFGTLKALEVIVVPTGVNITALQDLNTGSNVTVADAPIAAPYEHAGMMIHEKYATSVVLPALLRAIAAAAQ